MEIALMTPWIFLLFLGVFDFGFYAYAAICTANAARVAVLYTSSSPDTAADANRACYYALEELRRLPNVGAGVTTCASLPVQVAATAVPAGSAVDGAPASRVSVTYQTIPMFPIPGLMGRMTLTRTAEMRVKSS